MDPTFAAFIALLESVPVLGPVLPYVPLICGVAAILDVTIPPPPEGSPWVIPRKIVHYLGLNFGFARNAVPAGYTPVNKVADVVAAVEAQVAKGGEQVVAQAPTSPVASAAPPTVVTDLQPTTKP